MFLHHSLSLKSLQISWLHCGCGKESHIMGDAPITSVHDNEDH